ncbi:hypothetical protein [Zhongshania aquimaris]|uniref:MaoC-like domain-containing protein n=1 Tax=Zhongshania aquimaris TaxID=2857107 RepID=A0ABS6VNM4_9GAMM|nr:hypothetical protein [Zhongshania aquimaris]MBW2939915.1 hypothetical protein [Zhongshania aquimaris]
MKTLLYENVHIGDDIASLEVNISCTDIVSGALASRDYSPLHHDFHYVSEQAGHQDIFLNTPHQAALFERFLSDWSGPRGRLGRMGFTMKNSIYANSAFIINGQVEGKSIDSTGCGWVNVNLQIHAGESIATECVLRYALPKTIYDNPWRRRGKEWQP